MTFEIKDKENTVYVVNESNGTDVEPVAEFGTYAEAIEWAFNNSDYITMEDLASDSVTDGFSKNIIKDFDPDRFHYYMLHHSQPNDGRGMHVVKEAKHHG